MKNQTHVYAIIRQDNFLSCLDGEYRFTIKEIVLSQEAADQEVERLNSLVKDKNIKYGWQLTRMKSDCLNKDYE